MLVVWWAYEVIKYRFFNSCSVWHWVRVSLESPSFSSAFAVRAWHVPRPQKSKTKSSFVSSQRALLGPSIFLDDESYVSEGMFLFSFFFSSPYLLAPRTAATKSSSNRSRVTDWWLRVHASCWFMLHSQYRCCTKDFVRSYEATRFLFSNVRYNSWVLKKATEQLRPTTDTKYGFELLFGFITSVFSLVFEASKVRSLMDPLKKYTTVTTVNQNINGRRTTYAAWRTKLTIVLSHCEHQQLPCLASWPMGV